ncbi:chloride channel protein [Polyangium sp. 6x1]|uniref:chloride channel protein n=1 Tax=Polyangium sp. 6x1 TaxID=3042689 RepID=UPI0024826889|nr:chloride channel protein [Polyangium sp. 6x1]MDI1448497.1 chloride channel protein [Polyangium sp. 6x1]
MDGKSSLEPLRFLAGLLAVALVSAAFAVLFRASLAFVLGYAVGEGDVVSAMRGMPAWMRLLLPPAGALLAGVLAALAARVPSGHGVGSVMEAVVLGRVQLSMRVTLLKSLGSWCAIATGGSIGREGPLIQFGGAAGSFVSERLGLSLERTRILIAAGTAAGFAAAYNTPFAAILFVLEVVTGIVVLDTIVPAFLATVLATAITRALLGEGPIYGARAFTVQSSVELVAHAGVGVLGALAAQGFMRLLALGEALFARSKVPLPWRPALGGLVTGAIVAALPDVAGNGYEPLNDVLDARLSAGFVTILLIAKCVATTSSVSSGSPGGVFTPTLLLGGGVGFLYGSALGYLFGPQVGPVGSYALVGMAATTAATTHAPLMAAVMAFELSGDYGVVLPLMLATAIATTLSRAMRKDSIYTAELRGRGVGWELTLEGRRMIESRSREMP